MIGCQVKGYKRACAPTVGGADLLFVGDANDFDFTEGAADNDNEPTGYATITRRGYGSGAQITANVSSGGVTTFTVVNGGYGYTQTPTIVLTGGGGTGATIDSVTVVNGVITAVAIDDSGTGYTQAPTVSVVPVYPEGQYLFPIDSLVDTINVDITQANPEGSSSSYEYVIAARLAQMSQKMTNFNKKIDAAATCCQLLFVWRNNDGKIFVAGEKFVNGQQIVGFRLRQDGSKINNGKKLSEFNGQDLSIKGSYSRSPYEFTGGIGAINAFVAP